MSVSDKKQHIILASASPRRREILDTIGVRFSVVCADADEASDILDPEELTKELARRKGRAVYERLKESGSEEGAIIISADTVVACGGEILGKPRDADDARRMLRMLSGGTHTVATGVAVTVNGVTYTDCSVTRVSVAEISENGIEKYIASKEPFDKAGAYGIQGMFSQWVSGIEGCYFGVVGLPVSCLCELFERVVGCRPDEI